MDAQRVVKNLLLEGLELCSPEQVIQQVLSTSDDTIRIDDSGTPINGPIYIFAVGKASVPMYESAIRILKNHPVKSLVITSDAKQAKECSADEVLVGSHPTPDKNSLRAGERAIRFMEAIPQNAILINLISGGTSSLLSMPAAGISINALSKTFDLLINSGTAIEQINTVRKHCSQIKGGQLLRHISPEAKVINLAISDVPNDDISHIGSGPTIPDDSSFEDSQQILEQFKLWDEIPSTVRNHIQKGVRGKIPETVKADEKNIPIHYSKVISSASKLANTIGNLAEEKGFSVKISEQPFNDDVEVVASRIAESALSQLEQIKEGEQPVLLIFFGESTVTLTGDGKGGRNQELALRGAQKIAGHNGITWLSAGTDGIDGPTDAAGAIIDGNTIPKAKEKQLNPNSYLASNDSYHFHQQMGTLLTTGPTGNNLMDLVLVLIE